MMNKAEKPHLHKPDVSGSLSWKEAGQILERYNRWRRGEDIEMENPTIIGDAIDVVLNELDGAMDFINSHKGAW